MELLQLLCLNTSQWEYSGTPAVALPQYQHARTFESNTATVVCAAGGERCSGTRNLATTLADYEEALGASSNLSAQALHIYIYIYTMDETLNIWPTLGELGSKHWGNRLIGCGRTARPRDIEAFLQQQ